MHRANHQGDHRETLPLRLPSKANGGTMVETMTRPTIKESARAAA